MGTPNHDPPSSPISRPPKIAKMEDAIDISEATTALAVASAPSSRATPIPSGGRPDAKARRYDRQLRLWASTGQRSLESARILLIGDDASGCQTLKNLVLPGIQHFSILSDRNTTPTDVATNFFLEASSVSKSIALEEVRLLRELNPAVDGKARIANATELLASEPNFFLSFTLIIASNVPPKLEEDLAELLWHTSATVGQPDIPLVSIRTSGLTGRMQIQLREHCVGDTHPDTTHTLRIDQPFPALESYARKLDIEAMDSMDHSHIPWVVLLVRAACLWKDSHDGKLPSSSEDKADFKKLLTSWRRKGDEENFDEALAQAYRVWTSSALPYDIADLLREPSIATVSHNSKNLHLLLHALSRFLGAAPHLPPVSPSLPDMHSSTQSYVMLQNLYKQQYFDDLTKYSSFLAQVLQENELSVDAIPANEIESFVKNVGGVAIIKGSPISATKAYEGGMKERIAEDFAFGAEPTIGICLVLAILASEQFYKVFGRWPGSEAGDIDMDVAEVERFATKALTTVHIDAGELPEEMDNAITEVVRGGFLTPPTTAAFFGGIAAQEVIKLVTNQYNPLDNTAVVDLVKSGVDKFKL
ncbi:uncharacterized protein EHS24_003171 [Apiotrichum porosum]|uniref:NEDD8-activating enzyme E1 regulatory subunit n=1 Tax=Apiotrichum porosum TaxID=105984 RepID=A0A427XFB7_9TREE|nr:uncharacterized protein EHS24_003171 [Apiotrichum porosum]RSH77611.1 hypothetical protein EHS24_003171 [Apiotrichum porosum]